MSDVVLQFGSIVIAFFLRIAALYLVCLGIARLCPSARRRFGLWLAFVLGAAGYWLVILVSSAFATPAGRISVTTLVPHKAATSLVHALWLPASWTHAVDVAGPIISALYVLLVLVLVSARVWKHVMLGRTLRAAAPPSPEVAHLFAELRRALRVRRCDLLIVPELASPATACWWRPRVLLPENCDQAQGDAYIADALWHELIHVARRDYLWSLLSDAARCLLFFHPAVASACRRIRIERELACDAAVVALRPDRRADYAESLTRFARLRMLQGAEAVGIDFSTSASLLEIRIRTLLKDRPRASCWQTASRAVASAGFLIVLALLWPGLAIAVRFVPLPAAHSFSPVTRSVHLAQPAHRATVRAHIAPGAARERSQPLWQHARLTPARQPAIDVPVTAALPRFVPSPSGNGPETADQDWSGARSEIASNLHPGNSSTTAWTESVPVARRRRSSVARSIADGVLTGIAVVGLSDHDRTVPHGHPR